MKLNVTDVGHFVGGFVAAVLTLAHPVLAVVLTALFIIYEMDESWSINDEAFRDIKIYLLGGFAAAFPILFRVVV